MLCDEVKRAVYFYLDGALDDRRNDDFRTHLDDCPGCDQRMLVHRRMREFVRHRLAQITGLPLVPASYHLSWKICLKSWDRFQIPLPFGRAVMKFGEPLRVPRQASETEREQLRQELEQRLNALTID